MKQITALLTLFIFLASGTAFAADAGTFTSADDGKSVSLQIGDTISVSLTSNPSTGYRWSIETLDQSVLKHSSKNYASACEETVVGCGGEELFGFEAVSAGSTTLKIAYYRSWQSADSAISTFRLNVSVLGQGTGAGDACIMIYDPVCGADGKTYSNLCVATQEGVDVLYNGECHECEADADGNGIVDRNDVTEKKAAMDEDFQTWKKNCWNKKQSCGDYNGDGVVNIEDRSDKKADQKSEFEAWKDNCWLAGMTTQSGSEGLGQNSKVSECGGFTDTSETGKGRGKVENLTWKYDLRSKTVTFLNENVTLNCCGNRSVTVTWNDEDKSYEIYENDKADVTADGVVNRCKCECTYDFQVEVPDVDSGIIRVKLIRVITDEKPVSETVWTGTADLSKESDTVIIGTQSEFVSADENSYIGKGAEEQLAAAPTDDATNSDDVAREIEEADIIKIEGTYLYILNQYRGLFVCDISKPDQPKISGRADVTGEPLEMYIRDNLAYIIVSAGNEPVYGIVGTNTAQSVSARSRITVVDLNDKTKPKISDSFLLDGSITDSRIVGNILYVVSSENPYYYYPLLREPMPVDIAATDTTVTATDAAAVTAEGSTDEKLIATPYEYETPEQNVYIASIDISDPSNIKEADREDFKGSAQYVHVTDKAVFISSSPNYYTESRTTLTYVDISDPKGAIVKRGSIEVPGQIADEYKMDYSKGYFRVCTYNWADKGISNLFVIDVANPDKLNQVGAVELGKGEQLFATRFDGDRAYMVTYERKDPLWVIDLSDPTKPAVKGELIVPGWSTHIEVKGDRLIALGVDDTDGWKVAVSLFDVSDAAKPSLVKRVSFGDENGWSTSSGYDDVKAFTILDDMGLILLPYSFSSYTDGTYRTESRLQLIDYTSADLTVRGWVSQKGSVLRSRSFQDRLFSVSADEIQVINAADRDKPVVTGSCTLVRNVTDFMPLENGYGVQVVIDGNGNYSLMAVSMSEPDAVDGVSETVLNEGGYYTGILGNGNLVYVVSNGYYEKEYTESDVYVPYYSYSFSKVTVFDFSDPAKPAKKGSVEVPGSYSGIMPAKGGAVLYPYYYSQQILQVRDDLLVFPTVNNYYYDRPIYYGSAELDSAEKPVSDVTQPEVFNGLMVVDLSDADAPAVTAKFPLEVSGITGLFAQNDMVFFSYKKEADPDVNERPQAKYYLGRVDVSEPSKPASLFSINMPGACVGMTPDGQYAYTMDTVWGLEADSSQDISFNTVKIEGDTAVLLDTVELDRYFNNILISDGRAYLSSGYWWSSSLATLTVIDLADVQNLVAYKNELPTGMFNMIAAKNRKIFATSYNGIACYDISDPTRLLLEDYRDGWYNKIFFTDSNAYIPMGYYGLWVKGLN